jgi:DNA-binding NarL/FixJ family response regulator
MTEKKKIFIIDDHALFREGLKAIISRKSQYEIIGEAGNAREALQLVQELKPDLILMDIALPDRNGVDLTREIRNILPEAHILIVSMHTKIDYIVKTFQAGASGYVVKESASEKLLQGMGCVLNGEIFMDSSVSQNILKKLIHVPEKKTKSAESLYDALSPREQEILVLLAGGNSAKQIAEKLFISPKTVENHRSNIMQKLGLHSTLELFRYAMKIGLIDGDVFKES